MNCIPKRIIDDSTLEMGVVNLGKYTLPKTPAFAVNVLALDVRHDAKNVQIALLLK